MHWIIFAELKKFVETTLGESAWEPLVHEAGLGSKSFLAKIECMTAGARACHISVKLVPASVGAFISAR